MEIAPQDTTKISLVKGMLRICDNPVVLGARGSMHIDCPALSSVILQP